MVAASDVVLPPSSSGARHVAAYRKWLGLEPYPSETPGPARWKRQHKATAEDLDLSASVELIALSVTERARLDVGALGLVPLRLEDTGTWDPREHYWGEEDEPIGEWAKPIIARGPRPEFEMEQVLPGDDPDDPFADPITESNDLKDAGDPMEAHKILMELCQSDLRCLDAHAHLGNFVFDRDPGEAIRHYEVGLRIGELSLGERFEGVLLWGHVDNRPFLRCMHGYGLCLWRLGRFDEAERVFGRMLWLTNGEACGGARWT